MINVILKVKGSEPTVYLYFYNTNFTHKYLEFKYLLKKELNATDQDAYFAGCTIALKTIIQKCSKAENVNIYSSNQPVMKQMKGDYKINKKTQQNLYKKNKNIENNIAGEVKYQWVRSNNLHPQYLRIKSSH